MAAAPKFHVPPQLWWLATGPLRRGSPLGPSATARRRTLRCRPARRPPPRARGSPSPPPVCACARVAAAAAPSARLAAERGGKRLGEGIRHSGLVLPYCRESFVQDWSNRRALFVSFSEQLSFWSLAEISSPSPSICHLS